MRKPPLKGSLLQAILHPGFPNMLVHHVSVYTYPARQLLVRERTGEQPLLPFSASTALSKPASPLILLQLVEIVITPTRIGLQRLNSRFVSIGNRHEARKAGVHNSPHAVEDLVRRQGVFRLVGRSHIAGPRERPTISVTLKPHKLVKPNCLPGMCPDMAAEPRPHSASHQCVAVGAHSAWLDRGGALGQQRLWQTFASPHRGSAGLSQDRQSEVRVSRFLDIRGEHDPLPLCRNFRESSPRKRCLRP